MASSKYQDLVDTATRLFAQYGYTAVGIDRIIAEAGVAKMTLYKHFASKQDLIVAVLKQRDQQFMQSLQTYVLQYTELDLQIKAILIGISNGFSKLIFTAVCLLMPRQNFIRHKPRFKPLTKPINRVLQIGCTAF